MTVDTLSAQSVHRRAATLRIAPRSGEGLLMVLLLGGGVGFGKFAHSRRRQLRPCRRAISPWRPDAIARRPPTSHEQRTCLSVLGSARSPESTAPAVPLPLGGCEGRCVLSASACRSMVPALASLLESPVARSSSVEFRQSVSASHRSRARLVRGIRHLASPRSRLIICSPMNWCRQAGLPARVRAQLSIHSPIACGQWHDHPAVVP